MATNIGLILQNLFEFHEFSEKTVVAVGAGGGQLADLGRKAAGVIVVDNDSDALEKLKSRLAELNLTDRFELEVDTTKANEKWHVEVEENLRRQAEERAAQQPAS